MGLGEFIGNGSVHWRVLHEEYEVAGGASTGPRARTGLRQQPPADTRRERARLRTADVPPDVPAQHIANLDVLDFEARGKDTITLDQVGRCCGMKDHEGHFRVEMRYLSLAKARAALRKAAMNIRREGKTFVVTLDVPVIDRTEEQVGPPADPPAEVKVDW
jgi:hypothetical protein